MKAEWISVKDKKPETDLVCLVTNERSGHHHFTAIYQKYCDCWIQYDVRAYQQPPLDVTHYLEIPESPAQKYNEKIMEENKRAYKKRTKALK